MIITKIRLQEEHPMSNGATTWPLPFIDLHVDHHAGENGYLLKASDGLGPPEFTAVVEGFDAYGVSIMDSLPSKREVVLRIGLVYNAAKSYSELRDDIYKLVSKTVLITLMDKSLPIAQESAFIKRIEQVTFTATPEVQVTLECATGVFSAPTPNAVPLTTLNTLNPVINYEDGTAPTGIEMQFTVTAPAADFEITGHGKFWHAGEVDPTNLFRVTYSLIVGDVVKVVTEPRYRRVTLTRSSVDYDLAGYLNPGAVWPRLYPGVNAFTWDLATSWMTLNNFSYTPRWWGV